MFQYDFYMHYAAGTLALQGRDCYDIALLSQTAVSLGFFPDEAVPFPYPPYSLWLFMGLALLPFPAAQALWFILGAVSIFLSLRLIVRLLPGDYSEFTLPVQCIVTLTFFPIVKALWYGQLTPFLLFLALYGIKSVTERGSVRCGAVLSILLIKPHLSAPILGALALVSRDRGLRLLGWIAMGAFAQYFVSEAVSGGATRHFLDAQPLHETLMSRWLMPSTGHLLSVATGVSWLKFLLWGAVSSGALFAASRARLSASVRVTMLCVIFPLALLGAPYGWTHDFVFLFPVYVGIYALLYRRLGRAAQLLLLVFMGLSLLPFSNPRLEFLNVWVPWAGLAGGLIIERTFYRALRPTLKAL